MFIGNANILGLNPVGGAPSFTNTKSLLFDGVDEYVDCGTVTQFNSSANLSVSIWFKFSANTLDRMFEGKIISTTDRFLIYHNTGGNIIAQLFNGGSRAATLSTTYDTNWHHLVLTYDGSGTGDAGKLKMYLDGSLETLTFTGSGSIPSSLSANSASCYIAGSTNLFTGNVDEVSIFNYTLSASQITSLYNSGTPTDLDNTSGVTAPVHWWRMGDGDTFPTITDVGTTGGNNGTMTNQEVGDIVSDVPS